MGDEQTRFTMRAPCQKCTCQYGEIRTRGQQDCVFCTDCGAFQYNAPRVETGREVRSATSVHNGIKPKQRTRIIERAHGRCEACGSRRMLEVSHFVSADTAVKIVEKYPDLAELFSDKHINSDDNLAALCKSCNSGQSKRTMPAWLVIALVMARQFEDQEGHQ
jgi:5-methylcytosine-specific restriction endonuclease McrA